MANCSNCSAPLPPNSIKCDYCGSRNDTDLKGVHHFTTHEIESRRNCPRCALALRTIDLKIDGKFLIERCDQCLGLFFDPGELEALLEATVSNVYAIDGNRIDNINAAMVSNDRKVAYVKCPVCSKLMNRVNFGAKSGVIVDRCRDHGVWLDAGELRHLFEWMKAGGQLLEKESREEQKRVEEREERRRKFAQPASQGGYGDYPTFDSYGSVLRNSDPDFFDIVVAAIRFFTR